jgi:hypothetical protein
MMARPSPLWLLPSLLVACEQAAAPSSPLPEQLLAGEPYTGVDPLRFGPDDLWRYNNGAAEKYLQLGFSQLRTATYAAPTGREAQVELYRMEDLAGAAALLQADRPTPERALDLGAGGQIGELSLSFHRGRCYVRVVATGGLDDAGTWLPALGSALDQRLGDCGRP